MQISLINTLLQLSHYSVSMISSRLFTVLAASVVCASTGHCQPLDQAAVSPSPVVVQPHDQITQDLKSVAPESDAKLQPTGKIASQLTAIAKAEKPASPMQILSRDDELA